MNYLFGRPHNTAVAFSSGAFRLVSDRQLTGNEYLAFWHTFVGARSTTESEHLFMSANGNIRLLLTPDGDFTGSAVGAAGDISDFFVSRADMLAQGVDLTRTCMVVTTPGGMIWANGVVLANWIFRYSTGGAGPFYIGGPATTNGSFVTGLSLWSFPVYSTDQLPTFSQMYNGGKGMNLEAMPNANYCSYFADFETPYYDGFFDKRGVAKLRYASVLPYFLHLNRQQLTGRKLGSLVEGLILPPGSTQLSEYIYEGAPSSQAGMGRTGPVLASDGSERLPDSWAQLEVSNNYISGESVVRSSYARNVSLNNQWEYMQGPAVNRMRWIGQQVDVGTFNAYNAHFTYLRIAAAAGKQITIGLLEMRGNNINQTMSELFDMSSVTVQTLYMQGQGITGPVVLPQGMIQLFAHACQMTGDIPVPPASMTYLELSQNWNAGRLPATFNNVSFLNLNNNKLRGVLLAPKATNIRLGESGYINGDYGHQQSSGQAEDWIDLDLRTQQVDINELIADGCKIRKVYWPDGSGKALVTINRTDLGYNNAFGIQWANSWPANVVFKGDFVLRRVGLQENVVLPLGTIIQSTAITLHFMGWTAAQLNANVDAWLDNQAGWPGPATAKYFDITNNPIVTNDNRPTRETDLYQTIEDKNWIVVKNASPYNIQLFAVKAFHAMPGVPDVLILEFFNTTAQTGLASIFNTGLYDGDGWTTILKCNTLACAISKYQSGVRTYVNDNSPFLVISRPGTTYQGTAAGAANMP